MRRTLSVAALLLCAPLSGRGTPQVIIESRTVDVGPGILSANFRTNLGIVFANFPADLRPGEQISGTLAVIGTGKKESDRAANTEFLRSFDIEVCGGDFPVALGLFICPRVTESGSIQIDLKLKEKDLSQVNLDVPKVTTLPGSQSFILPTEGIVLNRARILGPFDGDASGTSVRIGDSAAHIVAESPRACIFDVPQMPLGPTRIELREGKSVVVGGLFRTVGLRLTPPRPIIHTGDSTSFTAEVYSLTGLVRPLQLTLKNLSPEIVSMERGDAQDIAIAPSDVSPAGTFTISRRLTGRHPGDAVINVSIPWSEESFQKALSDRP